MLYDDGIAPDQSEQSVERGQKMRTLLIAAAAVAALSLAADAGNANHDAGAVLLQNSPGLPSSGRLPRDVIGPDSSGIASDPDFGIQTMLVADPAPRFARG